MKLGKNGQANTVRRTQKSRAAQEALALNDFRLRYRLSRHSRRVRFLRGRLS